MKDHIENNNLLDEDGYPTESALDKITSWHWDDPIGWFKFINDIWYMKSWGWHEGPSNTSTPVVPVQEYNISTAGWSGNESIIAAMQNNRMLWYLTWVQSRRGGHYIFKVKDE